MRWNRYSSTGRAQPRVLEQLGHVEAEHAVVEIELVVALSNSQACSPSKIHGSSRDGRSPGCGRRPPPSSSRMKRSRRSSGPWAKISSTALAIAVSSSAPSASSSSPSQSRRKARLTGVVGQRSGLKPVGSAAADPLVAAADARG